MLRYTSGHAKSRRHCTTFLIHFHFQQSGGTCRAIWPKLADPSSSRTKASTPVQCQPEHGFQNPATTPRFCTHVVLATKRLRTVVLSSGASTIPTLASARIFYRQLDDLQQSFSGFHQVVLCVIGIECAFDIRIQARITNRHRIDKFTECSRVLLAAGDGSDTGTPRAQISTPTRVSRHPIFRHVALVSTS